MTWRLSLGCPDDDAHSAVVRGLVDDRVASRLVARDPTLWGPDAEEEASKRLAWVGLAKNWKSVV